MELLTKSDNYHPDIFPSYLLGDGQTYFTEEETLRIVLCCAALFPITMSRLNSLQNSPLPDADAYTSLGALHPGLVLVEQRLISLVEDIASLRYQTALLLQRWYEICVLCHGECWTEWEERLLNVEKRLRRQEMSTFQNTEDFE